MTTVVGILHVVTCYSQSSVPFYEHFAWPVAKGLELVTCDENNLYVYCVNLLHFAWLIHFNESSHLFEMSLSQVRRKLLSIVHVVPVALHSVLAEG